MHLSSSITAFSRYISRFNLIETRAVGLLSRSFQSSTPNPVGDLSKRKASRYALPSSASGSFNHSLYQSNRHFYTSNITDRLTSDTDIPVPHYNMLATHTLHSPPGASPLSITSDVIIDAVNRCWNPRNTETTYQPSYIDFTPFEHVYLAGDATRVNELSNLAKRGCEYMHARSFVRHVQNIDADAIIQLCYRCVQDYIDTPDSNEKTIKARALHDAFIAYGWIEKYYMFEGYAESNKACSIIPKAIAQPYELLSLLFGNHQEFLYYVHYVGASCANMDEMRTMMQHVDFTNSVSIKEWVASFKDLYGFQMSPSAAISERYFRFIHLAMEMVYSRDISTVMDLIDEAIYGDGDHQTALIDQALTLLLGIEKDMHATFKTLPMGSDPRDYNQAVRFYIAGTYGRNCGTVFNASGKYLEGAGLVHDSNSGPTATVKDMTMMAEEGIGLGSWVKLVGQTGAGTSVRPIMDAFLGVATNAYKTPLDKDFVAALMKNDQSFLNEYDRHYTGDPLTKMLTIFRGITRPPSHNHQIVEAFKLSQKLLKIIVKNPHLTLKLAHAQLIIFDHRVQHYYYVDLYINKHSAPYSQQQTAATGGTNTFNELPDLVKRTLIDLQNTLSYLPEDFAEERRYFDDRLKKGESRVKAILKRTLDIYSTETQSSQ